MVYSEHISYHCFVDQYCLWFVVMTNSVVCIVLFPVHAVEGSFRCRWSQSGSSPALWNRVEERDMYVHACVRATYILTLDSQRSRPSLQFAVAVRRLPMRWTGWVLPGLRNLFYGDSSRLCDS